MTPPPMYRFSVDQASEVKLGEPYSNYSPSPAVLGWSGPGASPLVGALPSHRVVR